MTKKLTPLFCMLLSLQTPVHQPVCAQEDTPYLFDINQILLTIRSTAKSTLPEDKLELGEAYWAHIDNFFESDQRALALAGQPIHWEQFQELFLVADYLFYANQADQIDPSDESTVALNYERYNKYKNEKVVFDRMIEVYQRWTENPFPPVVKEDPFGYVGFKIVE